MHKSRILVVEDESIVAEHLQKILAQLGYEAGHSAATGEEAVELAEQIRPDLVLMDIMLAGDMDGIQAADRIRSRMQVPVIYLTAYAEDGILQRAKTTEPFGYLLKPFRKESIRTAIEMALYKSSMERKVLDSEAKYRDLAELMPQIIFETDTEGRLTYVNRSARDALGITPDDLSDGVHFTRAFISEDNARALSVSNKVFTGDRVDGAELTALFSLGAKVPVAVYASPIKREQRVVGMRGVAVDITVRKAAEEALRRSRDELEVRVTEKVTELAETSEKLLDEIQSRKNAEELAAEKERLFRAVFESARDCVFVKDRTLRYTLVNPEMESLLGLPSSSILGRTDEELFGPDAGQHLRAVDLRVLEGDYIEEEHTRPVSGGDLTFLDVRVPLRNNHGKIIGLCGISRNVTERKRAQQTYEPISLDYPSQAMQMALRHARHFAQTDSIVLLLGESGTGKDHLARWIHDHSSRAAGPFFTMNCATLTQELAESELFGHEQGAFTGARGRLRGLLELAEGGTLLLNEIGDLAPSLQAKLLTFLDTRTFCRVGGREMISVNARLMAATNRDLEIEAAEGRFRSDLFYRLNVLSLRIPPLRERRDDVPVLVSKILSQLASELQLASVPELDAETMKRLSSYSWPGNIRELRNVLERGLILSGGGAIRFDTVPQGEMDSSHISWSVTFPPSRALTEVIKEVRRRFVEEALRRSSGNKMKASRMLHVSRYTLRRQMESLGLAGKNEQKKEEDEATEP
jgi:PAS domain S-box-containing protein